MPTLFMLQTLLPSRRKDCSPSAPSMRFSALSSKIATSLASLVKGRWIDGKTQALILLLSVCDTSAFFIHQIFLPSRRRDCHTNLSKTALSNPLFVGRGACPSRCTEPLYPHDHCKRTIIPRSHQPLSKPHYPSKIATTLAFK